MARSQNPQHVVTGKVRLSFVHLFSPSARPGGEPKYSTTILLPKSDVATKQRIDAAINAAVEQGVQKTWGGVRPPVFGVPVYDGDGVRPSDGMPFGPECKGHWVFTASSKQAPQVVDAALNPIVNQSEVYSGMYANVSVDFFPYSNAGKKGIGCGLGNVQKVADGEPLGGRTNADEDFQPQQPAYVQPGYGQQPPQTTYGQPTQQTYGQQPVYNQQPPQAFPGAYQPPYTQPQQPVYPQPAGLDPITGKPANGPIMGLQR